MPLFGRSRDRKLLRGLNEELLQKIIGVEIALYKLAITDMDHNIYGESSEKRYYNPIRLHALVRRDDTVAVNNETGEFDTNKSLSIGFLRDELVDIGVVLEISDIIEWDGGYYQIDNVRSANHWWGRNPDTSIPVTEGDVASHGYSISIIAEVHRTSMANLNLVEVRSGINNINSKSKLPRNL
jgi:hypothetical protein